VLGQFTQAPHVHRRLGGLVDGGRDPEAARVFLGDGQEVLGCEAATAVRPFGVAEPGGQDAGCDSRLVHGGHQALDRRPLGQVGTEHLQHALLFVLGGPPRGEGLWEDVHPRIDHCHVHHERVG
jgi:hypothetical protein